VKSSGRYVVEAESKTLYELLRKPVDLDRLRRYIEHCGRCVAAFIRGFADSEGSVDKNGNINIYNTDLRLLTYIHGSS
jgi:intein-encoded DNA endonuclease-like protein